MFGYFSFVFFILGRGGISFEAALCLGWVIFALRAAGVGTRGRRVSRLVMSCLDGRLSKGTIRRLGR